MLRVFTFERVAVVVSPWWEPGEPPELGTRVEVRLLPDEPHRGSESAAQRIVADLPVWRADLFDQVGAPAGNLLSAHFHPGFDGVEPRSRTWPESLRRDPIAWLTGELGDLVALCVRSGRPEGGASDAALSRDADALRAALPEIVAAVERTWAEVRDLHRDPAAVSPPG